MQEENVHVRWCIPVQVRVEAAMLEGNPWKPEVDIGHGLVAWDVNSPCASSTDQVCYFTHTLGPRVESSPCF